MFSTLLSMLPWVGGAGIAGYAALWFFFPSVIPVIAEYLKALAPLVRGVASGLVEFVSALWAGFLDMLDNAKSVLFVVTVAALSAYGGWSVATLHGKQVIAELHRDFVCSKRTYVRGAKPAVRLQKTYDPLDFLRGIF